MKLDTLTEVRHIAEEKYLEYRNAPKNSMSKLYKDATKLYYQIKKGKKIIEIAKIIKAGGLHENGYPKLAIGHLGSNNVICRYYSSGNVGYFNRDDWRQKLLSNDIFIQSAFASRNQDIKLSAPIPFVPPKYLPQILTDDYYVLWEVEEWKPVAPTDPYLLKRLTKNHFIVVAGWDLTEVEKSVMNTNL